MHSSLWPSIPSRRWSRQILGQTGSALSVGMLAAAAMPMLTRAQSPTANQAEGDFAGLVDIGGRSISMESAGTGAPTVVLVAGALGRGDVWGRDQQEPEGARLMVFPTVASFTHVIEYDRPGTS